MNVIAAFALSLAAPQDTDRRIQELERQVQELRSIVEELRRAAPPPPAPALQEQIADLRRKVEAGSPPPPSPDTFRMFWKEGLRLETADKAFRLAIGGRVQNDWVWWIDPERDVESAVGDLEDGTEFRRVRVFTEGVIYDHAEFKMQLDYAGGAIRFTDAYVGVRDVPVLGRVRLGQMYEPFGLEEQESDNYITFVERAGLTAFTPGRHTGLRFDNTLFDRQATWSAGVFRTTDAAGDDTGDGEYSLTARLTGIPWYEEEGPRLLHLGVGMSRRETDDDGLRLRERPEVHQSPRFVDTGAFAADDYWLLDSEVSLAFDSLYLQGEIMAAPVRRGSGLHDALFGGWYVKAGWFITGESRPYNRSEGFFGRVVPRENLFDGPGAWELAVRYSQVDLEDGGIAGGELDGWTMGTNWYLNPNVRLMLNYVMPTLEDVGDADAFLMRFQVDF